MFILILFFLRWTFRKTKQTNKKQLRKIQANQQQKNLPQNSQSKALSSNAECRKYLPVVFPLNIGHKSHFTVISRAVLLCAARNQEGLRHCAVFLQSNLFSIGNHYHETCQSEWRKAHETSTPHKELQPTERSWVQERWSSPRRAYWCQVVSSENTDK